MEQLHEMRCVPCEGTEPMVTEQEIAELRPQVPQWQVIEKGGENRLERIFTFKDFAQALAFTDRVGALAEAEGHHPLIVLEWGKVTVDWWTHAIHGLHRNDFIMSAKTDKAYGK
jgi:4a-hydroxytetrahydrobiopterin dehydratase